MKKKQPATTVGDVCAIRGCVRPVHQIGFCSAHYLRIHKGGPPGQVRQDGQRGLVPKGQGKVVATRLSFRAIDALEKQARARGLSLYVFLAQSLEKQAEKLQERRAAAGG